MKRVVVTGMGLVSPLGTGVETVWSRLLEARSGISTIRSFDTSTLSTKFAGVVPRGTEAGQLCPEQFLSKPELRRNDDFILYAVAAAQEAFDHAGLSGELSDEDAELSGVMLGSGIGGFSTIETTATTLATKGAQRVSPFFITSSIINEAAGSVSIRFGLKGPNLAPVSACSTGAHAIGEAARIIRTGDAKIMLAGGSEAAVTPLSLAGFGAMRALSKRNDSPAEASRPWDRERDGFVAGEGAGVLVLEELEHALDRGASIYGELVGYALTGDAYHIAAPDPSGDGALRAMRLALKQAHLVPDQLDYVNAHATSTPVGDPIELHALEALMEGQTQHLAVSSTKSAIGHLLGAAGAVEAIFSLLAIRDQVAPPTLNLHDCDIPTPFNLVPREAQPRQIRAALSSSFGFGGTNAALVFASHTAAVS